MKKILIILLSLIPFLSLAQNKETTRKIYFAAEIGQKYFHEFSVGDRTYSCVSEMVAVTPIELTIYLGHEFNNQSSLNFGISIYDAFLQGKKITPLVLDYRYYFSKDKNSLFVNTGIGYTLFGPSDIKSNIFKLGVGYCFSICKSHRMNLGVSYDLNSLSDIFVFKNNSSFSSTTRNVDVYALNVKLGINF